MLTGRRFKCSSWAYLCAALGKSMHSEVIIYLLKLYRYVAVVMFNVLILVFKRKFACKFRFRLDERCYRPIITRLF